VLTNLAKVQASRKDEARADQTLWKALETDPNMDNALLWYVARQQEKEGNDAEVAAFRRVSALPGSWRAQLWLARSALEAGDLREAMAFYEAALGRVPRPAPADFVMQLSGDLGTRDIFASY